MMRNLGYFGLVSLLLAGVAVTSPASAQMNKHDMPIDSGYNIQISTGDGSGANASLKDDIDRGAVSENTSVPQAAPQMQQGSQPVMQQQQSQRAHRPGQVQPLRLPPRLQQQYQPQPPVQPQAMIAPQAGQPRQPQAQMMAPPLPMARQPLGQVSDPTVASPPVTRDEMGTISGTSPAMPPPAVMPPPANSFQGGATMPPVPSPQAGGSPGMKPMSFSLPPSHPDFAEQDKSNTLAI